MADTNYSKLLDLEALRPTVQITTKTEELQEVADAARDNMLRVLDLGYLPMDMFWVGFRYFHVRNETAQVLLRYSQQARENNRELSDEERQGFIEAQAAPMERWLNTSPELIRENGPHAVESMCDLNYSSTILALMSSQIVGMWTAFEALTGDLWEKCLNERPRLGFVALGVEPELNDDETEINRKRKLKYQFPVYLLRELKYDLRKQMGSLLRVGRKWDFARRNEASDAYYKTFKDDKKHLENIFEDKNLQWLAATRNAIVHDAGKANPEFTKLVQHHPTLKSVNIEQSIPIDADLVVDFANTVVKRIHELIQFIDNWMVNNHE